MSPFGKSHCRTSLVCCARKFAPVNAIVGFRALRKRPDRRNCSRLREQSEPRPPWLLRGQESTLTSRTLRGRCHACAAADPRKRTRQGSRILCKKRHNVKVRRRERHLPSDLESETFCGGLTAGRRCSASGGGGRWPGSCARRRRKWLPQNFPQGFDSGGMTSTVPIFSLPGSGPILDWFAL